MRRKRRASTAWVNACERRCQSRALNPRSDGLSDFLMSPGYYQKAICQNNFVHSLSLPDEDVLEIDRKEKRVLIVADRDFGELIFQQGLAHAGVIFFRLPGAKLQTKIDQFNTVLTEHTDDLERGEFLVVTPSQIRIAGHPHA